MKTEAEMIAWIDAASLKKLLQKWRFAPSGDPLLQGSVGEHFSKVMFGKRDADNGAWVTASKSIGWGR